MQIPKYLIFLFLVIAFIGFLDAAYLTANHYFGIVPPCFVTQGCDTVTTSAYSKFLGIPISLLGSLFYLTVLISLFYYIDKKKDWILIKTLPILTTIGFLVSLRLIYLQVFVIKALCSYCLISATTSTILFVISLVMRRMITRPSLNI